MPPTRLPQKRCMNAFSILGGIVGGAQLFHAFSNLSVNSQGAFLSLPVGRTLKVPNEGVRVRCGIIARVRQKIIARGVAECNLVPAINPYYLGKPCYHLL